MMMDGKDEEQRDFLLDDLYDDGESRDSALDQLRRHMEETGTWKEGEGLGDEGSPG